MKIRIIQKGHNWVGTSLNSHGNPLILISISMKRTDKDLLVKGIKSFIYTALVMFLAPVVLYQAFKNTDKPLFIPVLIIGIVSAGFAIYMGFRSVNIVMEAVFGKKKKS